MKVLALLIFMAYGHSDRSAAARLRADLQRSGCQVWMDSEIPAGRDWTKEVERALDRSDAVVVLVSRGSARSFWVRAEVLRAQRKGKRVVPVIIEPGADLPLPLEPLQWVSPADAVQAVGCR